MKWRSVKEKLDGVRVGGWENLPSLDHRFTKQLVEDVTGLQLGIQGKVVVLTDPDYHQCRQLGDFTFQEFPQYIAYCEVFADVRQCLKFARDHAGLPVAVRSGGHSTAGFSINNGLVIDVSRLSYVAVDMEKGQATVGAGTSSGRLNGALDLYGLHVPSGGCHDVCVAGFMQGGGYGYTSREFGMNCDNVVEALVMLADGGVVVASDRKNADLFWALRGGTGGNFGVLLQVTYQLREPGDFCAFRVWWSLEDEAGRNHGAFVIAEMQKRYMGSTSAGDRTRNLGYMLFVGWQGDKLCLILRGMYDGPRQELDGILAPFKTVQPLGELHKDGCSYKTADKFTHTGYDLPQVPDLAREEKQSGYVDKLLDQQDWLAVIEAFRISPNKWSMLAIEPYGGAINGRTSDETAFIHRNAHMNLYVDVFWLDESQEGPAVAFLDGFMVFMQGNFFNEESYQNYPRRTQLDYRDRYWGSSFATLLHIKKKFDPDDFFSYPQGVLEDPRHPYPDWDNVIPALRPVIRRTIEYLIPPVQEQPPST